MIAGSRSRSNRGPAKGAAWGLEAAAGAVGGVVIGILLFVALWELRLRRIAASSEDGSG